MSTANRVIKNSGFLYAKMAITIFISLYTTRLVLNALGASDFGIFFVVGGAIAMLGFLNAAMAGATQRFMSFYEGKGDKALQVQIFNVSFVVHFAIALLFGIVLLITGYFLFDGILNIAPDRIDAAKVVYAALIISSVFSVMTVPYEAVLNAHENMLYYSIIGVAESLLKLLVAYIIVQYAGDKLQLYGILMACVPVIVLSVMRLYCHKKYAECIIAPKRYWNSKLLKEMAAFGGWSFLGTSGGMIVNYGHGIVVNNYFGTTINTSAGIASQITGQLNALTLNMMKALNPIIAKKEGAGDRSGMIKATILGSKISTLIMLFIFVPIWIEIPFILQFWLNDVPPYAQLFCRLLLINTLNGYIFLPIVTSLAAHGDIKRYQIVTSTLQYIPLFAMWILFSRGFAPYYSYITLGTYTIVAGIITVFYAHKNYQFTVMAFVKKVILRCSLVLFVMGLIASIPLYFMEQSFLRLFCVLSLSSLSYIVSLWFLGFDKDDRVMFSNVFKSILLKVKIFRDRKNVEK